MPIASRKLFSAVVLQRKLKALSEAAARIWHSEVWLGYKQKGLVLQILILKQTVRISRQLLEIPKSKEKEFSRLRNAVIEEFR